MGTAKIYWDRLYSAADRQFPWCQPRPYPSLEWILEFLPYRKVRIIDVGAGTSSLVDHLLSEGYQRPALLDISAAALALAKARLGKRNELVQWIELDLTEYRASVPFALWHDRAVFCFLSEEERRRDYVRTLWRSLFPGGLAMIATYAPGAPTEFAGAPISTYDAPALARELGPEFRLRLSKELVHSGPHGELIPFTYALFEKN